MARLTGKQRREKQSKLAAERKEKAEATKKRVQESVKANAKGRMKKALNSSGDTTKSTKKKSGSGSESIRAKNVAIHGEKKIKELEQRNKAFQEAKKKGTHRKKKLTNAEKLRMRTNRK